MQDIDDTDGQTQPSVSLNSSLFYHTHFCATVCKSTLHDDGKEKENMSQIEEVIIHRSIFHFHKMIEGLHLSHNAVVSTPNGKLHK